MTAPASGWGYPSPTLSGVVRADYALEAPAVPAGWTSTHTTRARKRQIAAVAHSRTMAEPI